MKAHSCLARNKGPPTRRLTVPMGLGAVDPVFWALEEHGVHEWRSPDDAGQLAGWPDFESACKRHGAGRPVSQKSWSHFFTPADHQKLRRLHVAPLGLCLFSGIGHGLAPHGYIMPPRLGLKRTTEGGKTFGAISLWVLSVLRHGLCG